MPRFGSIVRAAMIAAAAVLAVARPTLTQDGGIAGAPSRIGLIGVGLEGHPRFLRHDFRARGARPALPPITLLNIHGGDGPPPKAGSACPPAQWGEKIQPAPCIRHGQQMDVLVADVTTMSPTGRVVDVETMLKALVWMKAQRADLVLVDSTYPRTELVMQAIDALKKDGTIILELVAADAGRR